MRISDWSSDGCSSDLWGNGSPSAGVGSDSFAVRWEGFVEAPTTGNYTFWTQSDDGVRLWVNGNLVIDNRSEEHTSELQSLMRISYAVFCLKKKNKTNQIQSINNSKQQ